ncbi:HugZ family protein [Seohaeicola nanhaiensis]|uniref:HugZ family protein n=1 Tax=Seohaeicola nanhaiensis TaxID=1387282 RepID=A0ABV9KJN2_9RHOB
MPSPIRPTDEAARQMARDLIANARIAALAVTLDGAPFVSRIAFGTAPDGAPLTLISSLAAHTRAIVSDPRAALLLGEANGKGDPLNLPRLTLIARAVAVDEDQRAATAAHYLRGHPKAKLYIGFADFTLFRFSVTRGHLNGGFGKAFALTSADMGLPG